MYYLVTVDGADNLKKTTITKKLCERTGFRYVKSPNYDSFAGEKIKAILKGELPYEPASFQALNVIDRLITMKNIANNEKIICDRYCLSGIINGQLEGLPIEWLDEINSFLLEPNLMFIFTGKPYGDDGELFDSSPVNEIYKEYLLNKRYNPRIIEIDANRTNLEIVEEMLYWIWLYEV